MLFYVHIRKKIFRWVEHNGFFQYQLYLNKFPVPPFSDLDEEGQTDMLSWQAVQGQLASSSQRDRRSTLGM